jgi:Flp pilus assembly protein TadB
MAQTKRKRRTKHRGNAAGTIETRGRTGRPPTAEERKKEARMSARERRLNTPPTWKSSFLRGALAAVILFVFVTVTTKGSNRLASGLLFAAFALAIYVPAGYFLELSLYRRRQRKKEEAAAAGQRSKRPEK